MEIKKLANNLDEIYYLEKKLEDILKKVNHRNHLINISLLIPLMSLAVLILLSFNGLLNKFFIGMLISTYVLSVIFVLSEKNFFINNIMNKVRSFFYKKNKFENCIIKSVVENNRQIDVKSEKMLNVFFDEMSDIEKELLEFGVIGNTYFKVYDFELVNYLEEYIAGNEIKTLVKNKDYIFKIIDHIEYEEEQEDLINLYMRKVENIKDDLYGIYSSEVVNIANNLLKNKMAGKIKQI